MVLVLVTVGMLAGCVSNLEVNGNERPKDMKTTLTNVESQFPELSLVRTSENNTSR